MKKERGLELNVLSKRAESTYLHVSFPTTTISATDRLTLRLLTVTVSMMFHSHMPLHADQYQSEFSRVMVMVEWKVA